MDDLKKEAHELLDMICEYVEFSKEPDKDMVFRMAKLALKAILFNMER